jgi:hypothetical protein
MDHFPAGDWIDLVRGGLTSSKAMNLQEHLDRGCEDCTRSAETWRSVVQLLSREPQYKPPAALVERIKSAELPPRRFAWFAELAQFARLTFDSFAQPIPAMVRSAAQAERQLLHQADPFTIDLRLETDASRKKKFLIGQVLNSEDPASSTSDLEVLLLSNDKLVQETRTNESGEFDIEYTAEPDLQLFINLTGRRPIGISLKDLKI